MKCKKILIQYVTTFFGIDLFADLPPPPSPQQSSANYIVYMPMANVHDL